MLRKKKIEVLAVIAILSLSIVISCLGASNAAAGANQNATSNANGSIQLNYGGWGVTEHKMTSAELQAYQNDVGVYQPGKDYNQIVNGHGTGLAPPTASEWADIAENGYVVNSISYSGQLPLSVDLSQSAWFPPIGDQGRQGSCSFFADVYYAKSYQEALEHQWNLSQATWVYDGSDKYNFTNSGGTTYSYDNGHVASAYQSEVMSPAFVYHQINEGTDMGGSLEGPIAVMDSVGVSSWQNMPYNQSDYTSWPSTAAWAQAPYYRSNSTYSYQYIYVNQTDGVTNLKNWLASGNVATFAIDAVDNIDPIPASNSHDLFTTDNWALGELDHAQTIVGYNDSMSYMENGTLHYGAFKIVNSWGIGHGWENVPDGCYWVSPAVLSELSATGSPVILSQDLTNYQPQILATFNISHAARGDCSITFGLGNPNAPIVTKEFTQYNEYLCMYGGGNLPFRQDNMVFDLTEFKSYMTSNYSQPFFMEVYDYGTSQGGTSLTGTVNYFAVGSTISTQTPINTINNLSVFLTLNYSLAPTTLAVTPISGQASGAITLNGVGFTGNSVNISYLNPTTSTWISVAKNVAVSSENFSYAMPAPDTLQSNPSGDNAACSDNIILRAQDNGNSNSCNATYTECRRGLTQVSNQTASGLYGNNTNFATSIIMQNSQPIIVAGKWFSGNVSLFWDSTKLGTATVDQAGCFNSTLTVPATTAGQHTLMASDGAANVSVTVSRLPALTNDYANSWSTANFSVNLTADYSGTQIFYKINNGAVCNVTSNGQPLITSENSNNSIEYWGTWNVYGTGNMTLPHSTVTGIKLDKTAPQGSMQINGGVNSTASSSVTLTITATDSVSGVNQTRFSNDGTWTQSTWEAYSASKTWQLTSGDGAKTVYCQIQDNAGLTTTVSSVITLSTVQSTATPTASVTPQPTDTPTLPELNIQMMLIMLAMLTLAAAAATKIKQNKVGKYAPA